jgi:hypothetical protein
MELEKQEKVEKEEEQEKAKEQHKKPYRKPKLTEFGPVKDLTGPFLPPS